MAESSAVARGWWTRDRIATAVIVGVLLLGVVVLVVISQVRESRARSERVDQLFCTMSGVSPTDRGPETGRLCAELLQGALS